MRVVSGACEIMFKLTNKFSAIFLGCIVDLCALTYFSLDPVFTTFSCEAWSNNVSAAGWTTIRSPKTQKRKIANAIVRRNITNKTTAKRIATAAMVGRCHNLSVTCTPLDLLPQAKDTSSLLEIRVRRFWRFSRLA